MDRINQQIMLGVFMFIACCCCPSAWAAEVIVDNGGAGTSSTGTWYLSGGANPYGSSSLTTMESGATYTFQAPVTGTAEVALWWTTWSSRCTAVPVEIYDGTALLDTVYVDQQQNAGKWNVLGSYTFTGTARVRLLSQGGCSTCADALQLTTSDSWVSEVILDNGQDGTSSTGSWYNSGGANPYGSTSLTTMDGSATYTFEMSVAGAYTVDMWWTYWSSRCSSVPVEIFDGATLLDSVTVNQQQNASRWNQLGSYTFTGPARVRILAQEGCSTCADAVRLATSGAQNPPQAVIDSIAPNPAQQGEAVTFQGHGTDDGTIQSYVWESSLDGVLGTSATFTSSTLSAGTHTISFKVRDNDGLWSAPATQSLVIQSNAAQTIIDNGQSGTSSTGTWYVSSGANPYGENSLTTMESGATYTFQASLDGTHDVALWWTPWSSRCTAVPVDIYNGTTLLETVYVNQQQNAGQWNTIGTYGFSGTARVRLRAQSGCSTCADAVKFTQGDQQVNVRPVAFIDSIVPNPAPQGAEVQFTGHGTDSDGTVVFYRWESSLTGFMSNAASFSISTLPVGEHLITLTCTDNDGAVSNPVSTTLVIQGDGEPVPVVSDNGGDGTSSTGVWSVSGADDSWGPNSLWARNGATYTWRFTPTVSGHYLVSMWWTEWPSRATNAPVDIVHSGGTSRVLVNQQVNGGKWNGLGTYAFHAGQHYTVTITAVDGDTVSTCADAVRFEYMSAPPVSSVENIYVAMVYNWENAEWRLVNTLESVGAVNEGNRWRYERANRTYYIHMVRNQADFEQALRTQDAHILIAGHSNYGVGQVFATKAETRDQRIDDIRFLDDDRFFITSSPWIHVSISGMRTGQAYPFWWPVFKDGTSGIMPYDFDDPRGDPPYNYYLRYQLPGESTFYRVQTAMNGAIERFPDSGVTPWFSSTGATPNPNNPDHLKYFITNPAAWSPSFETGGSWTPSLTGTDFFRENYLFTGAGSGDKYADWLFTLPQSGAYNIYAWWPTLDNNTGGARYTIEHSGGETTRVMDQRVDGGQWNLLGQYSFGTGQYRVRLTDQALSGNVVADGIRITGADNTYSRNIDNVAYPKPHYRSKNILFRKELDLPKEELRYARLFFDTCNSGNYYLGTFDRGVVFYTLNLADGRSINPYLKGYLEGKTDEELWAIVQAYAPVWDYYDFSKTPSQQ
jgi:hypothetical protein